MRDIFTVRNSLLAIGGVGTGLLIWLTISSWVDAQDQRADATGILQSTEIEDLLLQSAQFWAVERGRTHAALSLPNPVRPFDREAIDEHRRSADALFQSAMEMLARDPANEKLADVMTATWAQFERIKDLRGQVDTMLEQPKPARDRDLAAIWFPSMTGLVLAAQRLRVSARYHPITTVRDIGALQELKHAISVMSESAQRESGLIAGTIAADDPLVLEDVERLSAFRGRLGQAWETVEAYERFEEAVPEVVAGIERVRQDYFDAFERIRTPIILAGMEGAAFPVTVEEWIGQSDAAIAPILELGRVAGDASSRLTAEREVVGQRRLVAATIILIVTIAIGAVFMTIVLLWIARPLDRITKAMTALADGDETVVVPSTNIHGEIGRMARAVQTFKDSLEDRARQISEANQRLQEANEELEQRVRQRTEELATARDEAIEANKAKSQFLANMSHELRTPLNAVIGFSEILVDKVKVDGQSELRDPLQRILRAGRHLLQLINDILDIAKVEAGKMELKIEPVSIVPLLEDAVTTMRPLAEKNGNEIVVLCPDDIQPIAADEVRLRQVLLNLLSNAAKFTEDGTIQIEVEELIRNGGDRMSIAVTDNGIGMTQEQIANVFMEFVQADATSTRRFGGTGLGLAISQRFCRLMGGEIKVESEPGKGSTFTIDLPTSHGEARVRVAESRKGIKPAPREPDGQPGKLVGNPLVLAIEDDPSVVELLRIVLKEEGYRLTAAPNGVEGVRLAKELHPAVITLDVLLPDLDGWGVLAALKSDPVVAEIPVVMLTIVDEATRGYALGAADYLTKPVERKRLMSVLGRYTGLGSTASILLVEDDDDARVLMARILRDVGCTVIEAADGRDALEQLEKAVPDLILLDLMLPVLDGFEFLAVLRRNPAWREVPVIVVTARDLSRDERERLHGAVSRILQKSAFSGKELLTEIRTLINASLRAATPVVDSDAAKLLYVEDNEDNVVLLKSLLESNGFQVAVAMDGEQGVAMAESEAPEVILMDMSLPVMNGWDATRKIKSTPATRDIPVIGVTAHAMAGDREKALAAGCDDYVTKPVDLAQLLGKVDRLLGRGNRRSS